MAAALLRQGKHCFLEKSIARTAEEFRPVLEAAAASGAHCLVDFPWRYHPALATMRELLDGGVLGRPLMVAAQMVTTQVGPGPGQRNPQHARLPPETEGGGMLHWLGQHFLEVLSFLGGDVRQVSAMCAPVVGNMAPDPRMDDVSVLAFRFAGGAGGEPCTWATSTPSPGPTGTSCTCGASRGRRLLAGAWGRRLVVNSRAPLLGRQPHPQLRVRPPPPRRGLRQLGVDVPGGGRLRARELGGAPPGGGPRRGHARAASSPTRPRRLGLPALGLPP